MRSKSSWIILSILFAVSVNTFAAGEVTPTFSLDGRLYADASATTPLTDPDVTIVIQILNPAQNCIVYEETQSHFNASIGNGYFTLQVGSVTAASKRSALDSGHTMAQVYSNTGGNISGRTLGGSACSYSPSPGDQRYVRMSVTPSSDNVTRVLSPNMALDAVPMATIAESAESVQGYRASDLLKVNGAGSQVLTQSNLESIFTSSNYSALTSLLSGSSTMYSKQAANGTAALPSVASPTSPSAGQMWYDSGAIKFYNGSSVQTLGVSGAGITSLSAGTGLNVGAGPGGTITSTGTLNIDVGTGANKIVQLDSSAKLPAVDGSALTNLPAPTSVAGSAISGTIGGSTAINTTGNVTAASVVGTTGSFGSTSTGQLSIYDHATTNTNYITIKTPATATLTADYTLTLPAALPGSSGQVLTSDISGVLTWSSPSTGSVTSVTSGGLPIVIGGTASAPTVSVNAATTSASGVVTLAASGGTTASTVVQATDSRLSDSRAPNGSASGDLSGTYPSPTVAKVNGKSVTYTTLTLGDVLKYDGTGWVNTALSSANLSNNSDLLKASNMPANCSSGSTLTFSSPTGTWVCSSIAVSGSNFAAQSANLFFAGPTTGSATPTFRALTAADLPASASYWSAATGGINYAGGNVGVGTTTPAGVLDLSASGTAAVLRVKESVSGRDLRMDANTGAIGTFSNHDLVFGTNSTERMRITAAGRVGIGTSSPASALDIVQNINDDLVANIHNIYSGKAAYLNFTAASDYVSMNLSGANQGWGLGQFGTTNFMLVDGNNVKAPFVVEPNAATNSIYVKANSNVGIGTASPAYKLDVNGSLNATAITINGTPVGTGSGTVTSVTSGGAPIVVGGTAAAPTVSVGAASTSAAGVVTLAASGGTTASTVVQATDARLSDSRAPSGTAAGDLSGSYPNPGVAKISGKAVTYTTLTSGDFLKYDGTGWVNTALSSANLSNNSDLLKASNMPANCSAGYTLTFSSPTGTWTCSAITITASNFGSQSANVVLAGPTTGTAAPTFRALTTSDLPASASYWTAATGGINYAGGKVGIGTTAPANSLSVVSAAASAATMSLQNSNGSGYPGIDLIDDGGYTQAGFSWSNGSQYASFGTINNYPLYFQTSNTPRIVVLGGGNVGVGTSTPANLLEVNKSQNAVTVSQATNANAGAGAGAALYANNGTDNAGFTMWGTGAGRLLQLNTTGNGGMYFDIQNAAGDFIYRTGSASEKMRLTSAGRLGIGTASPAVKLDVQGTSGTTLKIVDGNQGTGKVLTSDSSGVASWANPGGSVGAAVAWVTFNASGTILSSFNISSVSKTATGTFTVNFASALSDANYAVMIGGTNTGAGDGSWGSVNFSASSPKTTSAVKVVTWINTGSATQDWGETYVAVYQGSGTAAIANGQWSQSGSDVYRASGSVGIGTTTPIVNLHVDGAGSDNRIRVSAGSNAVQTEMFANNSYLSGVGSIGTRSNHALLLRTNDVERVYIGTSGNVGIGTTAPANKLHVYGDATINRIQGGETNGSGNFHLDSRAGGAVYLNYFGGTGGVMVMNGSAGYGQISASAFNVNSDRRLKKNIEPITNGLEIVDQLNGVRFDWISPKESTDRQVGVIAQDVQKVLPELVSHNKETGKLAVNYSGLVSPLIAAVKELYHKWLDDHARIDQLENENAALKARLQSIETRLDAIDRAPASK